jgi:hypothetical protein
VLGDFRSLSGTGVGGSCYHLIGPESGGLVLPGLICSYLERGPRLPLKELKAPLVAHLERYKTTTQFFYTK